MVRVLVVEDSPVVREFLLRVLCADPEIDVVGTAETGEEAFAAVGRLKPDIVTMDVHMPKMNGFDTTRRIMECHPTPILIVSGRIDGTETASVFRAIESGALAVLPRPSGVGHPEHERTAAYFVHTVKLMSEVKVVRRWPRVRPGAPLPGASLSAEGQRGTTPKEIRMVAIGASTGGPPVLRMILSGLPKDFPSPVLIVQHIAAGFTQGFVEWLAQSSNLPVQLPVHGQEVLPGRVYVAPDGSHTTVATGGRIWLNTDGPENGLRPSVSTLFRSVSKSYGQSAIGVLLTGMGKDGATELKLMRDRGSVTIAQDEESSVIYGMPGEAIRLGGATYVLSPDKISIMLTSLVARASSQTGTENIGGVSVETVGRSDGL
jgi:two-component system chemotaxis response regulator CheB